MLPHMMTENRSIVPDQSTTANVCGHTCVPSVRMIHNLEIQIKTVSYTHRSNTQIQPNGCRSVILDPVVQNCTAAQWFRQKWCIKTLAFKHSSWNVNPSLLVDANSVCETMANSKPDNPIHPKIIDVNGPARGKEHELLHLQGFMTLFVSCS